MKYTVLFAMLILAGCANAPPPLDVTIQCPPLRTWTSAEQAALAMAMAPIPRDSMIWTLELDWQSQRDAIRACSKSPKP